MEQGEANSALLVRPLTRANEDKLVVALDRQFGNLLNKVKNEKWFCIQCGRPACKDPKQYYSTCAASWDDDGMFNYTRHLWPSCEGRGSSCFEHIQNGEFASNAKKFGQLGITTECDGCGKMLQAKDVRGCSRCHHANYCSQECQKFRWPRHKQFCNSYAAKIGRDIQVPLTKDDRVSPDKIFEYRAHFFIWDFQDQVQVLQTKEFFEQAIDLISKAGAFSANDTEESPDAIDEVFMPFRVVGHKWLASSVEGVRGFKCCCGKNVTNVHTWPSLSKIEAPETTDDQSSAKDKNDPPIQAKIVFAQILAPSCENCVYEAQYRLDHDGLKSDWRPGSFQCANWACPHKGDLKGKKMKRCSACKTVTYCSAECQREHWPFHKPMCQKK